MADPSVQATSNANPIPVNTGIGLAPNKTPKIIPLNVDLTVGQNVIVDLTQQQQSGQIGPIQTIYINNSANTQPVTVLANVSNISYTIEAGDQAILPFFLPNTAPKFNVLSTGSVVVPIAVLDTPQPAFVWSGTSGAFTFQEVNGFNSLNVVDTALQALISNIGGAGEALNVNVLTTAGGGGADISQVLAAMQVTASGEHNFGGLADNYMVITGIEVSISNDAASTGGANSATFGIVDNGGGSVVSLQSQVYIPAATVAAPLPGCTILSSIFDPDGIHFNPNIGDGCGFFWNGNSLTSGAFNVNIYGYYTETEPA